MPFAFAFNYLMPAPPPSVTPAPTSTADPKFSLAKEYIFTLD